MTRVLIFLLLVAGLFLALGATAQAKIYKYVDANGTTVFVDDESRLPRGTAQKAETIREETDGMNDEERVAYEQERQLELLRHKEGQRQRQFEKELQEAEEKRKTPVLIRNNRIIVPVDVRQGNMRAKLNMLLDTGANGTVIYASAIERFHFRREEAAAATVAGGHVIPIRKVVLNRLEVGPFVVKNKAISIVDNVGTDVIDGLLGLDFLRKVKYEVDYEQSLILWEE